MAARSTGSRSLAAASATSGALCAATDGAAPPMALGQKYVSWRSAAEWNVRAWTPLTPSSRSRPRISPAALAVNVTASTCWGA